jgi:hypothetical protein
MADIEITFGPHEMNPSGATQVQTVDEDAMIKVMLLKGDKPVLKRAGDVAPPDRLCFGGTCFPVQ